jgi:hypothetical protein
MCTSNCCLLAVHVLALKDALYFSSSIFSYTLSSMTELRDMQLELQIFLNKNDSPWNLELPESFKHVNQSFS